MIDGTILIALITKNSDKWISDVLLNVEKYASFFSSYNTLIVDGYSTDKTKDISDLWCSRDPINRTFLLQSTKNLNRMDSITEARNTVINYYKSVFGKNVYLLLLDSDSPNQGPFNEIGFLSSFTSDLQWVSMFPNQVIKYYDLYALRDEFLTENYQIRYNRLTWCDGSLPKALAKYENPKTHPSGFYPVVSAFGGAGLYKTQYIPENALYSYKEFSGCPYDGHQYLVTTCEHVVFNNKLIGNKFINCKWTIGEHL